MTVPSGAVPGRGRGPPPPYGRQPSAPVSGRSRRRRPAGGDRPSCQRRSDDFGSSDLAGDSTAGAAYRRSVDHFTVKGPSARSEGWHVHPGHPGDVLGRGDAARPHGPLEGGALPRRRGLAGRHVRHDRRRPVRRCRALRVPRGGGPQLPAARAGRVVGGGQPLLRRRGDLPRLRRRDHDARRRLRRRRASSRSSRAGSRTPPASAR